MMSGDFDRPWPGIGVGGSLSLDFVNTLDWRGRPEPVELLHDFSDLLRWGRSAGALAPAEARKLRAWGATHLRKAAWVLAEAIEVRETIAALFQAHLDGAPLPAGPLARVERLCHEAMAARRLRVEDGIAAWAWPDGEPAADRPAWLAALDAAGLLTGDDRRLIRRCGDPGCGWLFLDTSRNGARRWCSMKSCGNRNKARRFYHRVGGGPDRG
jgi:predicted RNA-binding Zn ribbon-like protein